MALSSKQRSFVNEYLKDKNASAAARRVGYSTKSSREIGRKLLTKVDIKKEIDKGLAIQADKAGITAERVLEEIKSIAYQSLNKNDLKRVSANKLKACELLGKHLKLFTDVQEISGKDGGPQVVYHVFKNGTEAEPDKND